MLRQMSYEDTVKTNLVMELFHLAVQKLRTTIRFLCCIFSAVNNKSSQLWKFSITTSIFQKGKHALEDEVAVVIQQLRKTGLEHGALSSLCLGIFTVIRSFSSKPKKSQAIHQLDTSFPQERITATVQPLLRCCLSSQAKTERVKGVNM